jgi:fused signal recognition particle receptor
VLYVWIALAVVVLAALILLTLVLPRRRGGGTAAPPRDLDAPAAATEVAPVRTTAPPDGPVTEVAPELETPEPTAGRLLRLRARLARSQGTLGRGLLSVLSRENLDEDAWDEVEEALLGADVGVGATTEIVEALRTRTKVLGTRSQGELRALLADELVAVLQPELDRSLHTQPSADRPAVVLVVGVNGTGKTTTCGKLARVLVADGRTVLLAAAARKAATRPASRSTRSGRAPRPRSTPS